MLVPSIFSNNFVDDIFDDVFPFGAYNAPATDNRAAMNTDVKEFDDRYELEFELPGFKKEDIQAELKDGYLIVNAKHQDNKDEKDKDGKYIRKERYYGSYQRSFYVGDGVTQDDIKGGFENGILTLTVPKKEQNLLWKKRNIFPLRDNTRIIKREKGRCEYSHRLFFLCEKHALRVSRSLADITLSSMPAV